MIRSVVRGVGSYLPERVVTNAELEPAWSTPPTSGSSSAPASAQRHIAADGETTSDARRRGRRSAALDDAGLTAADIDLIVSPPRRPTTPSRRPPTQVQDRLGMHHGAAFDVQAVCSGFVYARRDRRHVPDARASPSARW